MLPTVERRQQSVYFGSAARSFAFHVCEGVQTSKLTCVHGCTQSALNIVCPPADGCPAKDNPGMAWLMRNNVTLNSTRCCYGDQDGTRPTTKPINRYLRCSRKTEVPRNEVCRDSEYKCVRSTPQWLQLERRIARWDVSREARASPHRMAPVTYAQGGTYAMTRAALTALASTQCVKRVASIKCNGWVPMVAEEGACEHSPKHEDAAVGLCMHLLGAVQATNAKCFSLPPRLAINHAPTRAECGTPLSMHPAKKGASYLRWWQRAT